MNFIGSLFGRTATDPIILDLDGGGVTLTHIDDSSAQFDLHNTGFAVDTGWIGSGEGFLVRDLNNNGVIDNITELFGNSSLSGFAALGEIDSNNDGKITSADAAWSDLKVWVDANGNGVTDSGELQSLAYHDIVEIDLNSSPVDMEVNGNIIAEIASFKYANNTTGQVAEAYFQNSRMNSTFTGDYTLNPEVLLLPSARGYGTVPDLFIAMSLDEDLLDLVKDFAAADIEDAAGFEAQIEAIIHKWAGAEEVAAGSRGVYMNAKHLAVLEAFLGQEFVSTWNGVATPNPANANQGQQLETAYQSLFNAIEARLLLQGPLAALMPDLRYDYATDALAGTADFSAIFTALGETAPAAEADARSFWGTFIPRLMAVADELGVAKASYEDALRDALEEADPAGLAAAILNNGLVIGDNTAQTHAPFTGGAHYIIAAEGNDYVQGNSGDDVILGGGGNDTLKGGAGNNVLDGGAGNDQLYLESLTDRAYGAGGNDTFITAFSNGAALSAGAVLDGGAGYDTLVTNANISAATVSGFEALHMTWGITLTAEQFSQFSVISREDNSNYRILGSNAGTYDFSDKTLLQTIRITGSAGDDTIIAGQGLTDIDGGAGDDVLSAGTATNGILFATGSGTNTVTGGVGNDTIHVQGTADTINAGAGDDVVIVSTSTLGAAALNGGDGNDTLRIGSDISTASVTGFEILHTTWAVTLTAAQLAQFTTVLFDNPLNSNFRITGSSAGTYDLSDKELLTLTRLTGSSGNDVLIGGTTTNDIRGGDGNDVIDASAVIGGSTLYTGSGTNIVIGSSGSDTVFVQGAGDTVSAGAGNDIVRVETASLGAATLNGGDGNDVLRAGTNISNAAISGFETLYMTWGVTLTGEQLAGFSTIHNDDPGSSFYRIFAAGAGTYDLSEKTLINAVQLTGSAYADILVGGTTTTSIIGGDGNDVLSSGSATGNVSLQGGNGSDTVSYNTSSAGVRVNLDASSQILGGTSVASNTALRPYALVDSLNSIENVVGSAHDDYIFGSSGDNILIGGAGADVLNGGAGTDTLDYSAATGSVLLNMSEYAQTLKGVSVAVGQAHDGLGYVDTFTSIENVISGAHDDHIYGSIYANLIETGDGNDIVNARAGNDIVYLGAGNDIAMGDDGDDIIYGEDGNDNIYGGNGNDTLHGGAGNDMLTGGAGNDVLAGGDGFDTVHFTGAASRVLVNMSAASVILDGQMVAANTAIDGLGGIDSISGFEQANGTAYNDYLFGSDTEADLLQGGDGDDFLFGNGGNDSLWGGIGNDVIYGGSGNDYMVGGEGSDIFVFDALNNGVDTIVDFANGTDKIDLRALGINFASLTVTTVGTAVKIVKTGSADIDITLNNFSAANVDASDFIFV